MYTLERLGRREEARGRTTEGGRGRQTQKVAVARTQMLDETVSSAKYAIQASPPSCAPPPLFYTQES